MYKKIMEAHPEIVIVGKNKGISGISGKNGNAVLVGETWLYDCLSEMKLIDLESHKISVDKIVS